MSKKQRYALYHRGGIVSLYSYSGCQLCQLLIHYKRSHIYPIYLQNFHLKYTIQTTLKQHLSKVLQLCSTPIYKGLGFSGYNGGSDNGLQNPYSSQEASSSDCDISTWSQWSPCSSKCGLGTKVLQLLIKKNCAE